MTGPSPAMLTPELLCVAPSSTWGGWCGRPQTFDAKVVVNSWGMSIADSGYSLFCFFDMENGFSTPQQDSMPKVVAVGQSHQPCVCS